MNARFTINALRNASTAALDSKTKRLAAMAVVAGALAVPAFAWSTCIAYNDNGFCENSGLPEYTVMLGCPSGSPAVIYGNCGAGNWSIGCSPTSGMAYAACT